MKINCKNGHNRQLVGTNSKGSCRECARIRSRRYYALYPDVVKQTNYKWAIKNKIRRELVASKWRKRNPIKVQKYQRESKWKQIGIMNLTKTQFLMPDYQYLLKKQHNRCAVCNVSFSLLKRNPDVDHNHLTKIVRGILCSHCNLTLGYAKENIFRLKELVKYAIKHTN